MKYIIIEDCEGCRFFSVFSHGKSKVGFRCSHPDVWIKPDAVDKESIKFPDWCPLHPIEVDSGNELPEWIKEKINDRLSSLRANDMGDPVTFNCIYELNLVLSLRRDK